MLLQHKYETQINIALVLLVAYLAKSANAYVDLFLNSNDTSNLLGN